MKTTSKLIASMMAMILSMMLLLTACGGGGTPASSSSKPTSSSSVNTTPSSTPSSSTSSSSKPVSSVSGSTASSNTSSGSASGTGSSGSSTLPTQPATGTQLAYNKSVTGQLFSRLAAAEKLTVNLKTTYYDDTTETYYFTRNSNYQYREDPTITRYIAELFERTSETEAKYYQLYSDHTMKVYESEWTAGDLGPLNSVQMYVNGKILTAGKTTIKGISYYSETSPVMEWPVGDGYTCYYVFCYDSSNSLAAIQTTILNGEEVIATNIDTINQLTLTCDESKFDLSGYTKK